MGLEYAQFSLECKAVDSDDDEFFRFKGKASVYGNVDYGFDVIEPGAFAKSLKKRTPIVLWGHRMQEPIGVTEAVDDTDKALNVVAKLPRSDSFVSGRVIPQVSVGSVKSLSVGFNTVKSNWEDKKNQPSIRHITEAELYEYSLVPYGMNGKAKVTGFKSFNIEDVETVKTKREFERLLRDSGAFSNKAVAFIASCLDEKKIQSDSEDDSTAAMNDALSTFKRMNDTLKGLSL